MLHDSGNVLPRALLHMLIYSRKDEMYASANLIIPSRRRHLRRRVYRTETADSCPTRFSSRRRNLRCLPWDENLSIFSRTLFLIQTKTVLFVASAEKRTVFDSF